MSINLESNEINLNPTDTKESYDSGQKIYNFLEKTEFLEKRKDDEKFEEWFQDLSYEDFESYLTRINGILREAKKSERKIVDSVNIGDNNSPEHISPSKEDKTFFLRETFENLKKLKNNSDRALLAFYEIQSIHPYEDGNGRTGRLVYEIFSNKTLNKDRLSDLLNHKTTESAEAGKGRSILNKEIMNAWEVQSINSRLIAQQYFSKDYPHEPIVYLEYNDNVGIVGLTKFMDFIPKTELETLSEKGYKTLHNALNTLETGWGYGRIALLKTVLENEHLKNFIKTSSVMIKDKNFTKLEIKIEDLLSNIKTSELQNIIKEYKKVEVEDHKLMNDIFLNPQNHMVNNKNGQKIPRKDLLVKS